MSTPLVGGMLTPSGSGAMVMIELPDRAMWKAMNWACCWPQLPPPASDMGLASGVKNAPDSVTLEPPLIWYLFDDSSDHMARPLNGPSAEPSHTGGLALAIFT